MSTTITAGTYRARAVGGQLGLTNGGKEQVAVEFELLDEGWAGTKITWYGYFSEKTEKRTIESLRYAGWRGDDLTELLGLGSTEVSLAIEHEEYPKGSGRFHAKVQWVNRSGLALKAPLQGDAAKAFAARLKAKVIAVTKAMPIAAADDDIGF